MTEYFDVSKYLALPPAPGFFVTGTDTEVGKTFIAGAIAQNLRGAGQRVGVFKPVATGCHRIGGTGQLVSEDAQFLARCADSQFPLHEITPQCYRAAVSPNLAAQREHRPVNLQAIFEAYGRICRGSDCMIVEGVGGLLCPLSDDFWVIHLAKLTRLPLVIVARAGLGTINHTLLTLHAARSAGLTVAGVVVNRYQIEPTTARQIEQEIPTGRSDSDLAMFTNPRQIAERGKVDVLAIVPDDESSSVAADRIGPDVQFAVDQVPWEKMLKQQNLKG